MMEPIGKATFVGDDDILYYDAESFLDCIREELPYSVVVKDVPAYTVYGGNPARFIKERFDAELKDLLLRYQWWNLEPEKLVEILPVLCDPDLEKLRRFLREQLTD